jgi:predicted  nucleic acid-binding Zn-ribbon protein
MTPRKAKIQAPKKKARMHPFTRALQFAEKRLAKAVEEQQKASEKLNKLSAEIPDLQRKIAALNGESNVGRVDFTQAQEEAMAKAFHAPQRVRDVELLPDLVAPIQTASEPDFLEETDRRLNQMRTK